MSRDLFSIFAFYAFPLYPNMYNIMAVMYAGLPELGLLGKESRLPELDQNGYEHRLIAAFIRNMQFE